jgi:hypothetical protein
MTAPRTRTAYDRLLRPISAADAADEPEADRLFIEPAGPFPRITLQTTVTFQGYTFTATFNDTSLADAVALLRRRACAPATKAAPPVEAHRPDQPSRGSRIISLATELLQQGGVGGWSAALEEARKQIPA